MSIAKTQKFVNKTNIKARLHNQMFALKLNDYSDITLCDLVCSHI